MTLDFLRGEIDALDEQIIELLDRRAALAHAVGRAKREAGLPMHDPARERQLLERLERVLQAKDDPSFPAQAVRSVFREVISACLSVEESLSIAFLGPAGTFTHMAAQSEFGLAASYAEAATVAAVFDAVERERASYGVVPIENSTEGVVSQTLDELLERDLLIVGEILLDVAHCLVGLTSSWSEVERVYSHPQALAQCRGWLARNLPNAQLVVSVSTAAAARQARDDAASAAVASRLAAELTGLSVLAERIQDRPVNVTRFVVLASTPAAPSGQDKTSIAFSLKHEHGALRRALSELEDAGLNLTRIESRPSRERIWEYVFLSDFEGHRDDPAIAAALTRLDDQCGFVRVLGSYPQATPAPNRTMLEPSR